MKRTLLIAMVWMSFLAGIYAQEPFRDADTAYNSGNYSDALKLYQRVAVTSTDDAVRAEAWFRSGYCQYALDKSRDAITSLENALTLNPRLQADVNIYPPGFVELFEIAQLRNNLLDQQSPATLEFPSIDLPREEVALPEITFPDLVLEPLPLSQHSPFSIPLDKNPELLERDFPGSMDISGEIVVAFTVDQNGTIQNIGTVFSDFPVYDRALLSYARLKWKIEPGTKGGRPVPSVAAYRLHLSSKLKGIKIIRANVRPVLESDPIPDFIQERYVPEADSLPGGSTFLGPESLDTPTAVKRVKVNFDSMDTRGTFQGVAMLNASGKIVQFRATEASIPAAIPALREVLKTWTFAPSGAGGRPVASYLMVDIELLYSLSGPDLESSERSTITILPR
ncbi:MAG TPA: hypothetical protein PK014_08975 [Thermoanaerobaculia bacterium]|nr:hypothetical protein [Thermoanaerobaculia bacterium]HUM30317.1 hypothetical protein [Thermoanaerobaculia bacterium]HXK68532.1 hypothetical protein [Thermoanaerobaculia bacterium]